MPENIAQLPTIVPDDNELPIADLETAEEDNDELPLDPNDADAMPAFNSPNWNEYVHRQFMDEELINGAPTCDGCRRVVEQLLGPILVSDIPSYIGPTKENNGTATVVVSIEILITNESHPANGRVVRIQEVADVNSSNTDEPYSRHPSATAATRAEGRALRKVLRLRNTITAEENSEAAKDEDKAPTWEPDEPITDAQIGVIDMLCGPKRLNMSVVDFINSGKRSYSNIRDVSNSTAQRMIQELNRIQREEKPKPPGISAYQAGWQNS